MAGSSIPNFGLGLLLAYLFSVWLQWLPIGGGGVEGLVLPADTLGFGMVAAYTRLLRGSMLDALSQGFIQVARAKGIEERWLISRHVLRHALLPVLNLVWYQYWASVKRQCYCGNSILLARLGQIDCIYFYLDPRIRLGGDP
ncbi:ABC transporter permease [Desulfolucianica intricata]|uniref:ABC transporter permease subunit n=1 Tax=Desulfolucanica intricata TaxID=1285191 RepID=UPI0008366E19